MWTIPDKESISSRPGIDLKNVPYPTKTDVFDLPKADFLAKAFTA